MSARPAIACARCGSEKFEHVASPRPTDQAVCSRCRARFTYDELAVAVDAQFGKDVDAALSRVREVNRRFPDR